MIAEASFLSGKADILLVSLIVGCVYRLLSGRMLLRGGFPASCIKPSQRDCKETAVNPKFRVILYSNWHGVTKNVRGRGLGDDSVGKMLSTQAGGPEFTSSAHK